MVEVYEVNWPFFTLPTTGPEPVYELPEAYPVKVL